MISYDKLIQIQINMCKDNVKLIKERIKDASQYSNDVVLLTEACGGFGDIEFEILDFKYIKGYPTLITNRIQNGLSGKGINVDKLKIILDSLSDNDILCVNLGFSNNKKDDIQGIMNCISHNSYDLKSKNTIKIYGKYAFELLV